MADHPYIIMLGTYSSKDAAYLDYAAVKEAHHEGMLGHTSASVVWKDDKGKLHMDRHNTTAKHLAWGGAIAGALIGILFPPLGAVVLSGGVITGMAIGATIDGAVLAGLGGLTGHFWHNIPKKDLREMQDFLDDGQAALVVVAVDKKEAEIEKVATRAVKKMSKAYEKGDFDKVWDDAVKAQDKIEKIEE